MQKYFNLYFTEIILVVLLISIAIVIVSILYVLNSSANAPIIHKTMKNKTHKTKMKYTKQFLKGVDGIDLDLKSRSKKESS